MVWHLRDCRARRACPRRTRMEASRPRAEINFLKVESRQEKEFLAPEMRVVTREKEVEDRRDDKSFVPRRPTTRRCDAWRKSILSWCRRSSSTTYWIDALANYSKSLNW
jgi:hypothetical protein